MSGMTVSKTNEMLIQPGLARELKTEYIKPESLAGDAKVNFSNTLAEAISETNTLQKVADKKMQELATGKTTNIPDVLIAVEKADIALKMMVSVRNKMIEAYQEVMKMQV